MMVTYENIKVTSDFFTHSHVQIELIPFINYSDCSKIWNTNVSGVYNMLFQ